MLKNSGIEVEIIDYLKTPPTVAELDAICQGLQLEPLALIRTGDKLFKELGLAKNDRRSRNEWLQLMADNPGLLERPIVVYQGKYALGRPPEKVKSIL